MFGVETIIISAVAAAACLIIAAVAKGAVEIIKALHEARDERATMKLDSVAAAHEAKDAATEAKDTAATGVEDIRRDLGVVVTGLARLDGRFSSLERKVVGLGKDVGTLGKDQSSLLSRVVILDEKVDLHVEESRQHHGD